MCLISALECIKGTAKALVSPQLRTRKPSVEATNAATILNCKLVMRAPWLKQLKPTTLQLQQSPATHVPARLSWEEICRTTPWSSWPQKIGKHRPSIQHQPQNKKLPSCKLNRIKCLSDLVSAHDLLHVSFFHSFEQRESPPLEKLLHIK